jgi:SnoaL-like polyketide cyclase
MTARTRHSAAGRLSRRRAEIRPTFAGNPVLLAIIFVFAALLASPNFALRALNEDQIWKKEQQMPPESSESVMQRFIEFINTGNEELVEAVIAPDAVFHMPGSSEPKHGSTAWVEVIRMMRGAFPDVQMDNGGGGRVRTEGRRAIHHARDPSRRLHGHPADRNQGLGSSNGYLLPGRRAHRGAVGAARFSLAVAADRRRSHIMVTPPNWLRRRSLPVAFQTVPTDCKRRAGPAPRLCRPRPGSGVIQE